MTESDSTLCIVGCGKKRKTLGFCNNHYVQYWSGKDLGVEPIRTRRANGTGSLNKALGYHMYGANGRIEYGHVLVAEKALGRKLKSPEVVHHVNGNGLDNRPDNLVVCPDQNYHLLLHVRQRAYDACGHADWRKCKFCKQYDDPATVFDSGKGCWHRVCSMLYQRARTARLKVLA